MSVFWLRSSLWLSLVLFVPVPFWCFGTGWACAAWLTEITGFTALVFLREGGMVPTTMAAVLMTQTIFWVATLFFCSGRILYFLPPPRRMSFVAVASLLLLLGSVLLPLYATEFVYDGRPVNLVELFE